MRTSLNGLFRLFVLVSVVAVVVAIGLARLEPVPSHFRLAAPPHFDVINGFVLNPRPAATRVFNPETGEVRDYKLPDGDQLEYGTCSPWQDEQGGYQIVGRWIRDGPDDPTRNPESFGLARYAMPSGRVLDRIPIEILPVSPPCWLPGTAAQVLFAAGDGRLYRLDFEPRGESRGGTRAPQAVSWLCKPPGERMLMSEPVWPTDPRLGGRVIVTTQYQLLPTDKTLTPRRLWWLELSGDGASIVAAGAMIDPTAGAHPSGVAQERSASLTAGPDGRLLMAYLWQPKSMTQWRLNLAPVEFDVRTGVPSVRTDQARLLHHNHVPVPPLFTTDGRWVHAIVTGEDGLSKIVRLPTAADPVATAIAARTPGDRPLAD